MKYLTNVVETYRVDSQREADDLIEEAKATGMMTKYSCVHKERKSKGEVVDDWFVVQIAKLITDPKEPERQITLEYQEG